MDNIVFAALLVINMIIYALAACRNDTLVFITFSFMRFDSYKSKSAHQQRNVEL